MKVCLYSSYTVQKSFHFNDIFRVFEFEFFKFEKIIKIFVKLHSAKLLSFWQDFFTSLNLNFLNSKKIIQKFAKLHSAKLLSFYRDFSILWIWILCSKCKTPFIKPEIFWLFHFFEFEFYVRKKNHKKICENSLCKTIRKN